jgi:heterodisulfide reductase subunit A2
MSRQVAVIGGGAAGLEASSALASMGFTVTLIEKEEATGGHIKNWHALFPNRRPGTEVINALRNNLHPDVKLVTGTCVSQIRPSGKGFTLSSENGWNSGADAVLMATGFSLFDARKKEEYGYGIYDNVITSAELEKAFTSGRIIMKNGETPQRVGFIHCVGSRDEKAGNIYCSKVCCVTAVKQAIEVREFLPDTEVFCFYMDLRMFGRHYEELYKEAQEKYNVQFIRGRLSESTEDHKGKLILKVEDTLLGKPLKIGVDLLVLMSGMESPAETRKLRDMLDLKKDSDNFLIPADAHLSANVSEIPGLFFAGTCSGPKNITDTLADARSAVLAIANFLNK